MNDALEQEREEFLEYLRQQIPVNILRTINERNSWIARYPILAIQFTDHYRRKIEKLRAQMKLVEGDEIPEFDAPDPDQYKRDHMVFLEMIGSIDPTFPVDDLHAQFCEDIDKEQRRYREALDRQKVIFEEAKHLRYDVALLIATGHADEARRLQEEFRRQHEIG